MLSSSSGLRFLLRVVFRAAEPPVSTVPVYGTEGRTELSMRTA